MTTLARQPKPDADPSRHIPENPAGSTQMATILVVEDDPTLRHTLVYNLTREGYRVLAAADGEQALAAIRAEAANLDLVMLDLMLPGLDGFQVLRQLRRQSNVPVLILSARGEEQDKVDGLELGADDYVVKPFGLRELLARVRAAIRRHATPAATQPQTIVRGPLRIELDRRRASVNDRELPLRRKEFDLLLTFALAPDRVFTRQDLLDAVWGDEIVVGERTVDVHISWLRGKLTDAGLPHDTIATVYGVGYRFVDPATPDDPAGKGAPLARE